MRQRSLYSEHHNIPGPDEIRTGLWLTSVGHYRTTDHVQQPRIREDYLLVYCIDGEGTFQVGERLFRVTDGSFFVNHPGLVHQYSCNHSTGWNIRWVHFAGERAQQLVRLAGFHLSQPVLSIGRKNEMEKRFVQMQRLLARHDEHGALDASAVLYQLLLGLRHQTRARQLRDHGIENALTDDEPNSVSGMAATCGLSRSHFTRKFRRATGISPWRYILTRRITRARDLLTNTELSIKEIAIELGFEDPNYFSRLFRQETNQSPTEFRNERINPDPGKGVQ